MADFDFKTKADWNSGFKNNVVGDDEFYLVSTDKLSIAPVFWENVGGGSRKAGWTDDLGGTSTITDQSGTPDYVEVIQQYQQRFAHFQRAPPASAFETSFLSLFTLVKPKTSYTTVPKYWTPSIGFYWDVDNWVKIEFDLSVGKAFGTACIAGTIYRSGWGAEYAISAGNFYWVNLFISENEEGKYSCDFWIWTGSAWFYLGGSVTINSWNFHPQLIFFGSGVSQNPAYPNPDLDNNGPLVSGPTFSNDYAMIGLLPLNTQQGSWQSPSISSHVSPGKLLREIIIEVDNGNINPYDNRYVSKVNILRASDDVVLSTWEGQMNTDDILYSSDFDNGFGVTLGVSFKVEVWMHSSTRYNFCELDRVAGNFYYLWTPQETLGISDEESVELSWKAKEEIGLADLDKANSKWMAAETLGIHDEAFATAKAIFQETLGLTDSESQEITIKFIETLGLHDNDPMSIATTLSETLGISDDIFQLSEVIVGITGIIAPLLDITNFDFCNTIQESGHVVYKVGTPDVGFQAYFFRKQTGQRFDIDLAIEPGDAVMFYCPSMTTPTISVGDVLRHNLLEYTVIAIRQKLHGSNKIYYKAACQLVRAVGVPAVTNPAATGSSGSALVTWDEVETTLYPSFDYYEVWMQKGAGAYQLVVETTGVTHTQRNLAADTYKFKIRAIDKVGQQGVFSGEVSAVVT